MEFSTILGALLFIFEVLLGFLYPFMRSLESVQEGQNCGGRPTKYWTFYWFLFVILNMYIFPVLAYVPYIYSLLRAGILIFLAVPKFNGCEKLETKLESLNLVETTREFVMSKVQQFQGNQKEQNIEECKDDE